MKLKTSNQTILREICNDMGDCYPDWMTHGPSEFCNIMKKHPWWYLPPMRTRICYIQFRPNRATICFKAFDILEAGRPSPEVFTIGKTLESAGLEVTLKEVERI